MHLFHTRNVSVHAGKLLAKRDGGTIEKTLGTDLPALQPGWEPVSLLSFGDAFHSLKLVRKGAVAYWHLGPNLRFVQNQTPAFLDLSGALGWTLSALSTDGAHADMLADLYELIEEFSGAAESVANGRIELLVGMQASERSAAMIGTLHRVNTAPGERASIFGSAISRTVLRDRNVTVEGPDHRPVTFDAFLPFLNFVYLGLSSSPDAPYGLVITRHNKMVVAILDFERNACFSATGNFEGLGRKDFLRAKLWSQYFRPFLSAKNEAPRRVGVVFRENHIGHYIWNELSAVDAALSQGYDVSVFTLKSCNEPVAPVDVVFPEVEGHVTRQAGSMIAPLRAAFEDGVSFYPYMEYRVSQRLADRIGALALAQEPALAARLDAAREEAQITLIGLRLENRCWIRQEEGYCALIRALGSRRDERFVLVFDGHNFSGGSRTEFIQSHQEHLVRGGAAPTIVQREIAMVENVVRFLHDSGIDNVEIVNLIPCSIAASVVASLKADYFVTHWGAGLAKYKWVANAPGCIVSSKAVLTRKTDVHIYDHEEFREGATLCDYFPWESVLDDPTAQQLIAVGQNAADRDNFDIDPEAFAHFVGPRLTRRAL